MPHAKYAEQVARGIEYLDKRYEKWWERVDLDTLDMASGDNHILAQIERRPALQTIEWAIMSYISLMKLGFLHTLGDFDSDHLTAEWVYQVAVIKERRG